MRTPQAEISVNGRPVASLFNERLVSVTIVDKEGATSDTISVDLIDGNPFARIPRKGDIITASLGYRETGVASLGRYTADDPEVRCFPFGLTVSGRGTDIRRRMKQRRARNWDDKTVKDIVSEIAGDNGLTALVDDEVGDHKYPWFGQEDESDLHVVERLAQRHGALFSVKDGKLIFARKGSGEAASGAGLSAVVAIPVNIVEGTCRATFSLRDRYAKVQAHSYDHDTAQRIEVEEESDEDGEADFVMPEPFADEGEARKAAKAKAKELKSETIRTSVTVFGDPTIRAGAPFRYSGVRPELDDIEFIIETATHRLSKAGYTTEIEAKLKV